MTQPRETGASSTNEKARGVPLGSVRHQPAEAPAAAAQVSGVNQQATERSALRPPPGAGRSRRWAGSSPLSTNSSASGLPSPPSASVVSSPDPFTVPASLRSIARLRFVLLRLFERFLPAVLGGSRPSPMRGSRDCDGSASRQSERPATRQPAPRSSPRCPGRAAQGGREQNEGGRPPHETAGQPSGELRTQERTRNASDDQRKRQSQVQITEDRVAERRGCDQRNSLRQVGSHKLARAQPRVHDHQIR